MHERGNIQGKLTLQVYFDGCASKLTKNANNPTRVGLCLNRTGSYVALSFLEGNQKCLLLF